jgi:hypothetical protein
MAPTEGYMKVFQIDIATRDNILRYNLKEMSYVRILLVRRTLGFWETTKQSTRQFCVIGRKQAVQCHCQIIQKSPSELDF